MSDHAGQDNGTLRVTIKEAAHRLGVTEAAVRKRIQRGSLGKEMGRDGRVYVYLDLSQDMSHPESQVHHDPLVEELADELRSRIRYLERQVEEEREARRRADTLLAQLMQRIPELEAPSGRSEATGAPQRAAEASEGTEPRSATGGIQTAAERPSEAAEEHDPTLRVGEEPTTPPERRSLWRWILGGGS